MVRDNENVTIVIDWDVMYLQSNDAIANIVHRDLDLRFQGRTFSNANIWKTAKACEKCSIVTL